MKTPYATRKGPGRRRLTKELIAFRKELLRKEKEAKNVLSDDI